MGFPVVLDIDGSVGPLPDAVVLTLSAWQERIRFGCGMRTYREFAQALSPGRIQVEEIGLVRRGHAQREIEERLSARELRHEPRGRGERHILDLRHLGGERLGIGPRRISAIENLADAAHRIEQFARPFAQRHAVSLAPQCEPPARGRGAPR